MTYWLDEAEVSSSRFCEEDVVRTAIEAHRPRPAKELAQGENDVRLICRSINDLVDPDRILVTDGGRYLAEAWNNVFVSDPRLFVLGHNSGAIGLGVAHAIGAATAEPGRTTLLLTGDGGFMMGGLNEFNTAVRSKLNLIVVMFNDSSYGSEHVQFRDRDMDPSLAEFQWPNFAPVAESLGGHGVTVRSLQDMAKVRAAIESDRRPLLVDVKMSPDKMPPPPW